MATPLQIKKMHIARKELAITDEAYRDILRLHFGCESSTALTDRQATVLLNHFEAKGWTPKQPTQPRKNPDFISIQPGPAAKQQRKVLALWNALGYAMDKLHTRVNNQFGVSRFEWLTDAKALHVLITDLEKRIASIGKGKRS